MSEVQETGQSRRIERIEKPQASSSKTRKVYVLGVAFVAVLLLGTSFGMMLSATTPGFPTVIEPGSMNSAYSYVIFKDGSTTYLKDGTTGSIAYSGMSSRDVIQYAIDAVGVTKGGSIYLKLAEYTVTGTLNITHSNITLTGDLGTRIVSSTLPVLTTWCAAFDDWTPWATLHNIAVRNLDFIYTGANITGSFIRFFNIGTSYYETGSLTLDNVRILASQTSIPSNRKFVGLEINSVCHASINMLTVIYFGTGIEMNSKLVSGVTYYEIDGNNFNNVMINYCKWAVVYEVVINSNLDIWNNLRIQLCSRGGVLSLGYVTEITFNSLHLEFNPSYNNSEPTQTGIEGVFVPITVNGGHLGGIVGHNFVLNGSIVHIQNTYTPGNYTRPYHFTYCTVYLEGNVYGTIPYQNIITCTAYNGGYLTTLNDGVNMSAIGGVDPAGATYVQWVHGLYYQPMHVSCSAYYPNNVTGWSWTSDATYLTIYFGKPMTGLVTWECSVW